MKEAPPFRAELRVKRLEVELGQSFRGCPALRQVVRTKRPQIPVHRQQKPLTRTCVQVIGLAYTTPLPADKTGRFGVFERRRFPVVCIIAGEVCLSFIPKATLKS